MDEHLIRRISVAAHEDDAPTERIRDLLAEFPPFSPETSQDRHLVLERQKLAERLVDVAKPPSFHDALVVEGGRPVVATSRS
jgi:hypothetical protein